MWEFIDIDEHLLAMWALVVNGIKLKIPFFFHLRKENYDNEKD